MTINGNFTTKSGSFSTGLFKHVTRKYKHDKNEASINRHLSHFNRFGNQYGRNLKDTSKIKAIIKGYNLPTLKAKNRKNRLNHHPGRQKTYSQYMSHKHPLNIGIATFGTMFDKQKLLRELNSLYFKDSSKDIKTRLLKAYSWGFRRYVSDFNRRHIHFQMTRWGTNVDEMGAPHLHFEMLTQGHTFRKDKKTGHIHKTGVASNTFTNAVREEYHTYDRRSAMRQFSTDEDNAVVKVVGNTIKERFPRLHHDFTLQKVGSKAVSNSMAVYKAKQAQKDNLKHHHLTSQAAKLAKQIGHFHHFKHTVEKKNHLADRKLKHFKRIKSAVKSYEAKLPSMNVAYSYLSSKTDKKESLSAHYDAINKRKRANIKRNSAKNQQLVAQNRQLRRNIKAIKSQEAKADRIYGKGRSSLDKANYIRNTANAYYSALNHALGIKPIRYSFRGSSFDESPVNAFKDHHGFKKLKSLLTDISTDKRLHSSEFQQQRKIALSKAQKKQSKPVSSGSKVNTQAIRRSLRNRQNGPDLE